MRNARNSRRRSVKIGLSAALLALLIAVFAAGCGSSDDSTSSTSGGGSSSGGKLDVVGYSTPESVYAESLEPAFEGTPKGADVSFSNSFGASGDQSRAVVAGQPASVVHFAQAGDMERLVEEGGLVSKHWTNNKYKGIAQNSVVVISVRSGNPDGIKSLDDVLSKDVDVVTPNPFSSGAARWNIMAV
jgi:sulfate/thiosulfate transport system substrate-binding protein